jgi:fimbrial chaperone protein
MVVEFGPAQRVAAITITLSANAALPMRLQAEVLKWEQDSQGQTVTRPTDELLISPPIAEVRPGQKQVFRVALRGARQSPEEVAYRLILEDIAEPALDESGKQTMQLNFRMRYDLPVMVAPVGKVVKALQWKRCIPTDAARNPASSLTSAPSAAPAVVDQEVCVRVLNSGNRRLKVRTLTLAAAGWEQSLSRNEGEILLAGSEREWRMRREEGNTGEPRSVKVQTTLGETLQVEPALP